MCQSATDGGRRCAAHTRPAYEAATPGTPEWDEAAAQYAAAPGGYKELVVEREIARLDANSFERALANGDIAPGDSRYIAAVSALAAYDQALRRGEQIREAAAATKATVAQHRYGLPMSAPAWAASIPTNSLPEPDHPITVADIRTDPALGTQELAADGKPVRVWTEYQNAGRNRWLDDPAENCYYIVRPSAKQRAAGADFIHVYQTTNEGITAWAYAHNVKAVTGDAKGKHTGGKPLGHRTKEGNDRGHLIAAEFGAGMETVNLVSMPSSVNQALKDETVKKRAERYKSHQNNLELRERYPTDPETGEQPRLGSYAIAEPVYRRFETDVKERAMAAMGPVGLLIVPTTWDSSELGRPSTDLIVATLFVPGQQQPTVYQLDCEVSTP